MHIPDDPSFYENFTSPRATWDSKRGRRSTENRRVRLLGPMVPGSGAANRFARRGNVVYPTAIGWHPAEKEKCGAAQHSAWETMQRSHAIANGCYVAAINRVGLEAPAGGPGIEFWGQSFVVAPSGEIIAKASVDQEEILIADVEWKRVDEHRTHWPFLRDRRIDAYSEITERLIDP